MTKKLFIVCAALVWTVALVAQNIAVVAANGSTKLYRTLQAAIEGADPNSTIYLPGGGFTIADSVKITKRLTIIGIGHKSNNNNVDGVTTISGNIFFNEGSSGSAVMACYITGNVNIGEGGATVDDVFIKCCNLNSIQVHNSTCQGTVVNQNYVRTTSTFSESSALINNNILHSLNRINGGRISKNIVLGEFECANHGDRDLACIVANNSTISNNIITLTPWAGHVWVWYYHERLRGTDNSVNSNLTTTDFGDNTIAIGDVSWEDFFVNYNSGAISPSSDFHFKDEYKQYENTVGVYADGVQFDKQLAPVPYIVAKKIDEQTDAAGKLNIKIRVKASGEE